MRKPIFKTAICVVLLTSSSWGWAQADSRRPSAQGVRPPVPMDNSAPTARQRGIISDQMGQVRPTTAKPLTEEECRKLGGDVVTETSGICNSGTFCGRRDQDGKAHRVCITAQ
jgi:hypothetical protein